MSVTDPSLRWGPAIPTGRFPWIWLPVQLLLTVMAWIVVTISDILGIAACLPCAYQYTKTGVWPKWGWAWNAPQGPEPESWWWVEDGGTNKSGGHWSTRWRTIGIYWWRAIRNPSSNLSRLGADCLPENARQTTGSHKGALNPYYTRMHGKRFAYLVRWDNDRPWLAWFEFSHRWSDDKFAQGKVGFKVGAPEYIGLGLTIRFHPYRTFAE